MISKIVIPFFFGGIWTIFDSNEERTIFVDFIIKSLILFVFFVIMPFIGEKIFRSTKEGKEGKEGKEEQKLLDDQ